MTVLAAGVTHDPPAHFLRLTYVPWSQVVSKLVGWRDRVDKTVSGRLALGLRSVASQHRSEDLMSLGQMSAQAADYQEQQQRYIYSALDLRFGLPGLENSVSEQQVEQMAVRERSARPRQAVLVNICRWQEEPQAGFVVVGIQRRQLRRAATAAGLAFAGLRTSQRLVQQELPQVEEVWYRDEWVELAAELSRWQQGQECIHQKV